MSKTPAAKPKKKSPGKPTQAPPKPKASPKAKAAKALTWPSFRALALSLNLPHIVETTSWGQPTLKAHGKLWAWWSPTEDAPVFKVSFEERELLLEMEPDVFFVTDHYRPHALVLARPDKVDPAWAKATLYKMWRAMAPKRALKAYDEGQG